MKIHDSACDSVKMLTFYQAFLPLQANKLSYLSRTTKGLIPAE